MDATTGSVPYASSNGNSAAAQIPNRFLGAAEGLALTFLERRGDGSAICTACYRGSVAGVLTHGMTCAPGRMLELAAEQRPTQVSDPVHVTERAVPSSAGETASEPEKDDCEVCHGAKGGIKGNENIVAGVVTCDYCQRAVTEPVPTAAVPRSAEKDLLGLAHKLLESLWHSREFALYITRESTFGRSVHTWLTRYAEVRLGRGFAVEMPGCAPAVLAVSESYSEPWSWGEEGGACFVLKSDGLEVALIAGDDALSGDRIIARRIAACVNACAGKSSEELEAGAGSR